jgi:hypothetical protein
MRRPSIRSVAFPLALAAAAMLAGACRSEPDSSDGSRSTGSGDTVAGRDVRPAPAKGLQMFPHEEWLASEPSGPMRKAQYVLPRVDGDTQDATLVVYHFGASGGTKEANLERWAAQFEQPDGRPSSAVLRSSTRKVDGLDVLDVELSGTYVAETSPGSGVRVHEEGWRLLASIVDTPGGAYYVKLVGPGRTVERWTVEYRNFVSSLRYAS